MAEKISAVICTYNEAENIAACIASVAGVDEVVVGDDGSTDRTVEIAKACGARVFRRRDWSIRTTQEDVDKFTARFGWAPEFVAGSRIRNGHLEARETIDAASNDWVVVPDADERVSWNLPVLRELLPVADQITGEFVHAHDEHGRPLKMSHITKMFRKSLAVIDARTHTCLIPAGRILQTNAIRIDHWQKPGHTQGYVLPILEYSVLVDDDQRSRFYLGREYYFYHHYDRALTLFDLYLKNATGHIPEIAQARLYAARCYWEDGSGRGDLARKSALEAVVLNPMHREALEFLASPGVYYEPWTHKWARLAEAANNEDILF